MAKTMSPIGLDVAGTSCGIRANQIRIHIVRNGSESNETRLQ